MAQLANLGLVVALLAAPCVAIAVKLLRLDPLALAPRFALWAAALLVLAVAAAEFETWIALIGLDQPTVREIALALPAAVVMLAVIGASQFILRRLGVDSGRQLRQL